MKVLLTATVQSHICQFHKPLVEVLHAHGCEVHVAARNNLAEKNGLKLDFVEKVFDIPFSRSPKSKDNLKAEKMLKQIINEDNTAHGFHFYEGSPKKNWMIYYPIEKYFSRKNDTLITITHEDYRLAKKKFHCQVEHIHGVGVDEETSPQKGNGVRGESKTFTLCRRIAPKQKSEDGNSRYEEDCKALS